MLRPRAKPERSADPAASEDAPVEAPATDEAVASHPMFMAPQFGYRRNPNEAGDRPAKPQRQPRIYHSR